MTFKIRKVNNLNFIIWEDDNDIEINKKVISKSVDKSFSLVFHRHDIISAKNIVRKESSSQRTIIDFTHAMIEKSFQRRVASSNDQTPNELNEYFVFRSLAQSDVELHTDIEVILRIILDYMRSLHTLRHNIETTVDWLLVTRIRFNISAW